MTLSVSSVPLPLVSNRCLGSAVSPLALPLWIDNARGCSVAQPITLGVPLPRGVLADPNRVGLVDNEGRACCVQTLPLAYWSDGSIKWVLLDFVLRDAPAGRSVWTLDTAADGAKQTPASRLHIEQTGVILTVDTGAATFRLDGGKATTLRQVIVAGTDVLDESAGRFLLTDARDCRLPFHVEQMEVETRGPVRATIRLEGHFPGAKRVRLVARICFFAGCGLMRLRVTLHNPRRAGHKGGLWDLGDPASLLFRELALELGLRWSTASVLACMAEDDSPARFGNGPVEIYQDSSGGENWQSRNHLNRHGQVPCSFRGYRLRSGDEELTGYRASPVVTIQDENCRVTAAVPEFWQQFPKAIEGRAGLLRIGLFPSQFGDLFELQGGEQKTHTAWLDFASPASSPADVLNWVHHPAHVCFEPECYAHSGAVPHLAAADATPQSQLDAYLRDAVQGDKSLIARREVIDEYGWRNFGEVHADHEGEHYDGPAPVISHYNNQYDQVYGALLQYWRTGDRRWFELADPLARHVIDIDIYHTDEDRAAYNGGLFWFTDHYKDAATCTHRTYSQANCRPGDRSYGGGPGGCHNFTTGLLHYYYQTGDPQARQSVLSLADWVVRMDDGRLNILGLIDEGPTGSASSTHESAYHGPGRGGGLSISALLDGWLLSGQRGYLDKAEELIRRCVHPADDITARNLLDIERRWSYTIFFAALARYLQLKAEAEELDFMYAYAQASLIHYARWMLDNERPYFDQREKLEYPTEAWAAQEFRKANVLRLASAHVEEPLRGRMLRRGEELADRAWTDLRSFASRYSARALALVLTEGTRDDYFRICADLPAPSVLRRYDFGAPTSFVPQKLRLRAQLRTFSGLGRALVRLANPRNWWRLAQRRG